MYENIRRSYQVKNYEILRVENIDEIRKIVHNFDKVFDPPLSERVIDLNTYAEKLYKNAIVFAAIEKNDFIGFIAFYANDKDNNVAYLTQIGVKDKSQNRDVGKSLLDLCIKTSETNNMKAIKLEVFNQNVIAIEFYKKYGFYFCGKSSSKSIYMMKKL
ncbi:GNAT family N-acetyltransferase [Proteiniborus sp. MB09-C3]|uniref:GNAT family N-acetyltransferase n=1 Tax=Proteiniborus sp. MB09-C3 TaxID=3050072 RepID=UPI002554093F|nr:GNAT family N-acetyltransferase [Proteiniborus sp. MB09-C3]WIV12035.1 GNAT family N-acetyltransferase [Proteiniborus sp. MB09-C3]